MDGAYVFTLGKRTWYRMGEIAFRRWKVFAVCISLDTECTQQHPLTGEAAVQELIYDNSSGGGVVFAWTCLLFGTCACVAQAERKSVRKDCGVLRNPDQPRCEDHGSD